MRVIRTTDPAVGWKRRCLCAGCGAVLEVEESDLTRDSYFGQYLGSDDILKGSRLVFDCLVCNLKNAVPPAHVPDVVAARLQRVENGRPGDLPSCVVIEDNVPALPEETREGWMSPFAYWASDKYTLIKLEIGVDGCYRCLDEPWSKESLDEASTLQPGQTCEYCERIEPCR